MKDGKRYKMLGNVSKFLTQWCRCNNGNQQFQPCSRIPDTVLHLWYLASSWKAHLSSIVATGKIKTAWFLPESLLKNKKLLILGYIPELLELGILSLQKYIFCTSLHQYPHIQCKVNRNPFFHLSRRWNGYRCCHFCTLWDNLHILLKIHFSLNVLNLEYSWKY